MIPSRGHSAEACAELVDRLFNGDHHPAETIYATSEGFGIQRNTASEVSLWAHHITGKRVSLRGNIGLQHFLERLAERGVGYMEKYDEVEYEFLTIYRDWRVHG
jgi:hypothetical protein